VPLSRILAPQQPLRSRALGAQTGAALAALALALGGLSGCAGIPRAGPTADEIQAEATSDVGDRYILIQLTPGVADRVGRRPPKSFAASFGDYRPTDEPRIGIGDSITVTIWEAGPGGLFSAPLLNDRISSGSNSATIPEQVVARDGAISVPYAGRIPVSGRTPRDVQQVIEKALEGKAIQPQVLVNVTRPISNSVTITGEVVNGARLPLTVRGDRLLDVIAAAGGVRSPINEAYIEVTRGGRTTRVAFSRVVADPKENIYVHPGDDVTVVRDPQAFLALGATGRNAEVPFETDGITLAEALAQSGGVLDMTADPKGVYIFRFEPISIVRQLRPDWTPPPGAITAPVVYQLDLTDPVSLFAQQRFAVLNRDVLYVSDASAVQFEKIANVFNIAFSAANNAATAAYYVKTLK